MVWCMCIINTRSFWQLGGGPNPTEEYLTQLSYVTISSTGNAVNFGDLDDEGRQYRLLSQTLVEFLEGCKMHQEHLQM